MVCFNRLKTSKVFTADQDGFQASSYMLVSFRAMTYVQACIELALMHQVSCLSIIFYSKLTLTYTCCWALKEELFKHCQTFQYALQLNSGSMSSDVHQGSSYASVHPVFQDKLQLSCPVIPVSTI
jgi:hypothetical protein